MCLDTGTELTKTDRKPEYGWKTFEKRCEDLWFPCYPHQGDNKVPLGRWLNAEKHPVPYEKTAGSYDTGFHVSKTKKGARAWAVDICSYPGECVFVKVKIKGVRIHGMQNNHVTYIADKMLVPKPKPKRKKKK